MPRSIRVVTVLAALALGGACQQRYEDVTTRLADADGGGGSSGYIPGFGGNGTGGAAGVGGGGGAGGMDQPGPPPMGGAGGADTRCTPPGSPEVCNGKDDDCNGVVDDVKDEKVLNDVLSCGSCDVVCTNPSNAIARCENKKCTYQCVPDAVDIDKGSANGCECLRTNGGKEICDGRDNDCNGVVDDGFDLMKDINNCGACNRRCVYPFAKTSCTSGACVMGDCLPGFYDRNKDPNDGCEVACGKTNGGVEICDGVDNDCDGVVDNPDKIMPPAPCKGMGVCAGTKPECKGTSGWVCSYGPDYQDSEDAARGCDGKDNDCDGQTDEAFMVGKACSAGMGACMQTGMIVCDPVDKTKSRCTAVAKAPAPEVCNGQDDDCDGKIDELDSSTDRTADDKLVYLPSLNVTMFAYEASRYDASDTSAGNDSARRPCSVANRQPWANVSQTEAAAACAAIGPKWRLCTRIEWSTACGTPSGYFFPYGSTYSASKCNGWDYIPDAERAAKNISTVPTGSPTMCTADQSGAAGDELFDMSGNVKEWVIASTSAPDQYEMRGGAYNVLSFGGQAPGLQCDAATPAPQNVDVRLPSIGFRCCLEGKLP